MNNRPKVSIIIPVYKAEKYIERCVRSLFSQTLNDIEYIFVDDASPDKSIDIVRRISKEYPERLHQIKIIRHDTNNGVSQSRQDGLDSSTGEYIIHCDPDDWIEPNMYESLYLKANEDNADIVICDYILETRNSSRLMTQKPKGLTPYEVLSDIAEGKIYGCFWNKLIRAETIIHYNIRLIPNQNVCEDLFFFLLLLKQKVKIAYLNEGLYHYDYIINPNSIQRTSLPNHIFLDEQIISLSKNILSEEKYQRQQAAIITGALFHLFQIQGCSNHEFRRRYSPYKELVTKNDSLNTVYKFFLQLSFLGWKSQSQKCFFFLKKIKRLFS